MCITNNHSFKEPLLLPSNVPFISTRADWYQFYKVIDIEVKIIQEKYFLIICNLLFGIILLLYTQIIRYVYILSNGFFVDFCRIYGNKEHTCKNRQLDFNVTNGKGFVLRQNCTTKVCFLYFGIAQKIFYSFVSLKCLFLVF